MVIQFDFRFSQFFMFLKISIKRAPLYLHQCLLLASCDNVANDDVTNKGVFLQNNNVFDVIVFIIKLDGIFYSSGVGSDENSACLKIINKKLASGHHIVKKNICTGI